jgi:hypothetical protein
VPFPDWTVPEVMIHKMRVVSFRHCSATETLAERYVADRPDEVYSRRDAWQVMMERCRSLSDDYAHWALASFPYDQARCGPDTVGWLPERVRSPDEKRERSRQRLTSGYHARVQLALHSLAQFVQSPNGNVDQAPRYRDDLFARYCLEQDGELVLATSGLGLVAEGGWQAKILAGPEAEVFF